ncbi:hypothetical protein PMIN04_003720 [Paraphaeosphaeria minitans]
MLNILGSLTKNGWRETFRILCHSDITICKQPCPPRKKYIHVRRRDGKGRKMRAAAFQLVEEQGSDRAGRTYRLVNDGRETGEDEVQEIVLEKKSVASKDSTNIRRQRSGTRQNENRKRKVRAEERDLKVEDCCPDFLLLQTRLAWLVRWLNSFPGWSINKQDREAKTPPTATQIQQRKTPSA